MTDIVGFVLAAYSTCYAITVVGLEIAHHERDALTFGTFSDFVRAVISDHLGIQRRALLWPWFLTRPW